MELLKSALEKVDRPGIFCTYGKVPFILPGLQIKGNEPMDIGLPLQSDQAKKLRELARQAPFGKGMQTIVDVNVRNVLELDPAEVAINNPEWDKMLRTITANVGEALGINQSISHHFYKLLLYEKGSFFLPHKDTEKEDRMFATLTITLPSAHQGGDLIISHEGDTFSFSFDKEEDLYHIQYAAFYADCTHEVKSVTDGYRLTLIYNLAYSGENDDLVKAPINHQFLPEFVQGLEQLREASANKFVFPLEYEYTEKNLSFQNLKSLDRAKAELMVKAAAEADFMIYLAFIHHWESGIPIGDDYHYGYRDYDDDHSSLDSYDMEEVHDEDTYIEHWIDTGGNEMTFGKFPLTDDEFVISYNFHNDEPYQQDYEGYAGNYGPTLDQVYRNAALVFWPKERHFSMLAKKGPVAAVSALTDYFGRYANTKGGMAMEECRQFSMAIMDHWEPQLYTPGYMVTHRTMLEVLLELDEPSLISQFIEKVMFQEVSGEEGPLLDMAGPRWDWSTISALHNVPKRLQQYRGEALSGLLLALCTGNRTMQKEQFCHNYFSEVTNHILRHTGKKSGPIYSTTDDNVASKKNTLALVFAAASWFDDVDPVTAFSSDIVRKEIWSLDDVLLPFLWDAVQQNGGKYKPKIIEGFASQIKNVLDIYFSKPLKEPTDWVQNVKLTCTCEDCSELQDFMLQPEEKIHYFGVNKERRKHLHRQIDAHDLDMTHITERSGSPYTLVCTKTRRTWERLKKQREYREEFYEQWENIF